MLARGTTAAGLDTICFLAAMCPAFQLFGDLLEIAKKHRILLHGPPPLLEFWIFVFVTSANFKDCLQGSEYQKKCSRTVKNENEP